MLLKASSRSECTFVVNLLDGLFYFTGAYRSSKHCNGGEWEATKTFFQVFENAKMKIEP